MHQEASGSFVAAPAPSAWDALPLQPDQGTMAEYAEVVRRELDCAAVVVTITQPFAALLDPSASGEDSAASSHVCAIAPAVRGMASGGKVLSDPARLADPIEAGHLGFGFYVGIPLRLPSGSNLGTLAAIDVSPRDFPGEELAKVKMLANILVELIGLRLTTSKLGTISTVEE